VAAAPREREEESDPVTTVEAATELHPPKHIKVNGKRIHFRWIQQIAWSVVGAAIGAYMVSAVYYLVTQVKWPGTGGHTVLYLKPAWDDLIPYKWWKAGRHDYRDCYEAVFATLFIRSIIAKKKYWGHRVGWLRLVTAPLVIFVAAFPIITLGIWLVDILHLGPPSWLVTYQAILIGFVAGQVVHRIYAPVGNTVQLFFVEQAIPGQHRPRWPLPPVVRERYAWMTECRVPVKDYGAWFTVMVSAMVAVLLFLAAYGAYVRLIVAKGR
jgi:hypothetical protein